MAITEVSIFENGLSLSFTTPVEVDYIINKIEGNLTFHFLKAGDNISCNIITLISLKKER